MKSIVGVDEVGRGAWAGPLVVAAVGLPPDADGYRDSKKLSPRVREQLSVRAKQEGEFVGLGWVSAREIDLLGLSPAMALCVRRAVRHLGAIKCEIVIDGNVDYLNWSNTRAVVKADDTVQAVAAASIVAKVARDNFMKRLSLCCPLYNFDRNVGYGTRHHHESLKAHGPTKWHRFSYRPVAEYTQ